MSAQNSAVRLNFSSKKRFCTKSRLGWHTTRLCRSCKAASGPGRLRWCTSPGPGGTSSAQWSSQRENGSTFYSMIFFFPSDHLHFYLQVLFPAFWCLNQAKGNWGLPNVQIKIKLWIDNKTCLPIHSSADDATNFRCSSYWSNYFYMKLNKEFKRELKIELRRA